VRSTNATACSARPSQVADGAVRSSGLNPGRKQLPEPHSDRCTRTRSSE
jgi:hypothetical protein